MKTMKRTTIKTITTLMLVIAMVAGIVGSISRPAQAANIKITYNLNGGTVSPQNTQNVVIVTLSSPQYVTIKGNEYYYPGKSIIGWSKVKGGEIVYSAGQKNVKISEDTILYAVWGNPSCKITYNPNTGGTVKNGPTEQSFTAGTEIKVSPPDMVKSGCTLLGLSTMKKASSVTYKKGQTIKLYYSTTLYAVWGGTVTYDPNGGKIVSGSKTQDFISEISFKMVYPRMVNGKRILLGFDTNPKATTPKYKLGQTLTFSSSVKLYAIWSTDRYQGKQAIVIFPGICGSNLYDADGDAFFKRSLVEGGTLFNKAPLARLSTAKAVFKRYANGDTQDIAGYDNYYLPMYRRLINEFYKTTEYEIVLYEYDWRADCLTTAKKFRDEVACKYDSMILIGHSMGGLVASSYLTLQPGKVEKAFFLGTPFLGAPLASYLFAGGDIDKFYSSGATGLAKGMKTLFELTFLNDILAQVPSFYELLPDCQSLSKMSGLSDYNNNIKSLYQYKSSDITNRIHSVHSKYWNGSRHVSNNVKSYYIVGTGRQTIAGGKNYPVIAPDAYYTNGDGTVPYISASYPSRTSGSLYTTTKDHTDMISDTAVLDYIVSKIKN